jgi:hypothetical protein
MAAGSAVSGSDSGLETGRNFFWKFQAPLRGNQIPNLNQKTPGRPDFRIPECPFVDMLTSWFNKVVTQLHEIFTYLESCVQRGFTGDHVRNPGRNLPMPVRRGFTGFDEKYITCCDVMRNRFNLK